MILKKEDKDFLLLLNASRLSDEEVEAVFAVIASLPGGEYGHPRSFKGRKVAALFFLHLLHAETTHNYADFFVLADSYRK